MTQKPFGATHGGDPLKVGQNPFGRTLVIVSCLQLSLGLLTGLPTSYALRSCRPFPGKEVGIGGREVPDSLRPTCGLSGTYSFSTPPVLSPPPPTLPSQIAVTAASALSRAAEVIPPPVRPRAPALPQSFPLLAFTLAVACLAPPLLAAPSLAAVTPQAVSQLVS